MRYYFHLLDSWIDSLEIHNGDLRHHETRHATFHCITTKMYQVLVSTIYHPHNVLPTCASVAELLAGSECIMGARYSFERYQDLGGDSTLEQR